MIQKYKKELRGKLNNQDKVLIIGQSTAIEFNKVLTLPIETINKSKDFFNIKKAEDYIDNKKINEFVKENQITKVIVGVYKEELISLFLEQFFLDKTLIFPDFINLFANIENTEIKGFFVTELNKFESKYRGTKNSLINSSKIVNKITSSHNIF